ncbi:unnamed protein product [Tilletia controversa]|nr:unnamed protein product [Tilletia controversa]
MVFGAEDTPRGPIPPHLRFAEPAPPADRAPAVGAAIRMEDEEEEAEPRHSSRSFFRAKSKDIGTFNPEQGDDIYSWWSGLVTYMECSRYTEAEMFAGLPGCFEGSSRHWFNTLKPRPRTLEELRVRAFSAYVRNESQVWEELDDRRFKPESERLDVYLADKLKLISELHVSRAVNRGSLSLEPFSLDSIMTTQTVSDAIQTAHQGLPPDWAILLDSSREAAQDWTDYRTRLLGKERGTRTAIALLQRPASSPVPSINPPRARPARTHAAAPREFDNTQSARPRAPSMSPVDEETRRLDREQGRCFACHTAGHAKSNCPSRASTVRVIKRILARLEDENDEEDEHFSMVVRQVAVLHARQRHTDADSASETDPEDNVARVRYARSVSVLADEPSPPSFGISPPTERDVDLKGHRHRDVVAHKAAVYLGNENERLELHVDGGSPLSMITPRALRTIAPDAKILPPEPLKIRGYRGDDFQRPSGVTLLPVSFPTANGAPAVIHHFEFHVVEECTGGWILGVDNMKADGIDALSKRELLVFESRPDAEVRLLQTSSVARHVGSPNRLVCAKKVRIEPHTVRIVEIDPAS